MLEIDPEQEEVAEPRHDVSVVNDKTRCQQLATVEQSALFHRNHKEYHIET